MDGLTCLAALALGSLVISPILALVAWSRASSLQRAFDELRRDVDRIKKGAPLPTAVKPEEPSAPRVEAQAPPSPLPPLLPPPRPPAPAPKEPSEKKETHAAMEKNLGVKVPVWIGAIALALAGIYLVKYSHEHGLLSPIARVTLAALFGCLLLGAGEWFISRSLRVASALSAAGIADLYASLRPASLRMELEFRLACRRLGAPRVHDP
ncbi:MAG: DUF2339 domain-containing protein [Planctomycetes bacterium]|nr:DUF2339 domain-containing protein [Planctomycetota bacterium]